MVENWHRLFRSGNKFPAMVAHKKALPYFLEANPDVLRLINKYGTSNLSVLSGELIFNYIHETIIPAMVRFKRASNINLEKTLSDYISEINNDVTTEEKADIIKEYGLTICLDTVHRWMGKMGFRYELRKKSYYVDNHEKTDTVEYRWKYVQRYLSNERRAYRWLQIPASEVVLNEGSSSILNCGYHYKNEQGLDMVEFHIDDAPMSIINNYPYGGNLSVLKPPGTKPLFLFGHDESIFKQFTFTTKSWTAPSGERVLIPKDEGRGIMISAIQSREFGFGMTLTDQQLEVVNEYRCRHSTYFERDSAIQVKGTERKSPLSKSPFYIEFEYGSGTAAKGYWDYEDLVIQFEDCVDVLKALYPDHDFLFQFDHSGGHDRQPDDALSVSKLNLSYGGKQPRLKDSIITEGCLGKFSPTLSVGQTQYTQYQPDDDGPILLSQEVRRKLKYDIPTNKVTDRRLTKEELIVKLKNHAIPVHEPRGSLKQIQEMCEAKQIPLIESISHIKEGWDRKPKGIHQILIERGLIDINNLAAYSLNGKKALDGSIIPGTSLKEILSNCEDFQNDKTRLEITANSLGVLIERSPKCHPELAGEGIEYSWGCSKAYYRNLTLSQKKGYDNFRQSVRKSMSKDVLSMERIRLFSKKARRYIVTYYTLTRNKMNESTTDSSPSLCPTSVNLEDIEKLVKKYKSHRCVFDTHKGLCYNMIQDINKHT